MQEYTIGKNTPPVGDEFAAIHVSVGKSDDIGVHTVLRGQDAHGILKLAGALQERVDTLEE